MGKASLNKNCHKLFFTEPETRVHRHTCISADPFFRRDFTRDEGVAEKTQVAWLEIFLIPPPNLIYFKAVIVSQAHGRFRITHGSA